MKIPSKYILPICFFATYNLFAATNSMDSFEADEPTPPPVAAPSIVPKPIDPMADDTTSSKNRKINFSDTLKFNPLANNVPPPLIQLDYNVKANEIQVGQAVISEETFSVYLENPYNLDPNLKYAKEFPSEEMLIISIPRILFESGSVQILSENGAIEWTYEFTAEDKKLGKKIYNLTRKNIFKTKDNLSVFASTIPLDNIPVLAGTKNNNFKFCLTNGSPGEFFTRICSPFYKTDKNANKRLALQSQTGKIRVTINEKEQAAKGSFALPALPADQIIYFHSENSSQYTFDFRGKPQTVLLTEYLKDSDSTVILSGKTYIPSDKNVTILNAPDESSWVTKFGFLPTIGDLNKYWNLRVNLSNPILHLKGIGGGEFTYKFNLENAPTKNDLIMVNEEPDAGTYLSEVKINGKAPPNSEVSSQQNRARTLDAKDGSFVWYYEARHAGEYQNNNLLVKRNGRTLTANYSIYRGFGNELSFRFAGVVLPSQQINIMGEFTYNHWFENLFSWNDEAIGKQRWGISFKSFQPLQSGKSTDTTKPASVLSLSTIDLKYRFTPGIWGRDESWGAILGHESVSVNSVHASLAGVGFFWARSMPKVFDDLFNYIPIFDFPKWVDLDFTYYPVSLEKTITPVANYALNFHGKVLWTKRIYGEGGFGFKSFDYANTKTKEENIFTSFYGTLGIGINF